MIITCHYPFQMVWGYELFVWEPSHFLAILLPLTLALVFFYWVTFFGNVLLGYTCVVLDTAIKRPNGLSPRHFIRLSFLPANLSFQPMDRFAWKDLKPAYLVPQATTCKRQQEQHSSYDAQWYSLLILQHHGEIYRLFFSTMLSM